MRILMLTQFYPPIVGGEERHVYGLSAGLSAAGHDVHVATLRLKADDPARELQPDGVTVHRIGHIGGKISWAYLNPERPLSLPLKDPVTARQLAALVSDLRPDVIHAHNWIVNSALAVAKSSGVPLVLTLHDYSHVCATKRLMRDDEQLCPGAAPRRCLPCSAKHYDPLRGPAIYAAVRAGKKRRDRIVRRFVSVSEYVAARSELERVADHTQVITNFVPDALLDALRDEREPALPAGRFVFFAGDLSRQKGVHTLLAAHAGLGPDRLPLVLVGRVADGIDGELPADVMVETEWPHARIVNAFQHCDVAALPSEWPDPCPTTVLEAMALGAPLVTTQMGGIATLVDPGRSALCVAPGAPAALGAALKLLSDDADLRRRLSDEGRRRVQRFTLSAVLADLVTVYESAR